MANAIVLTPAVAAVNLAGVGVGKSGAHSQNAQSWTYANGAGAADTIANSEFLKGLDADDRLLSFFSTSFANQAALDAAIAALGMHIFTNGGAALYLTTAGPGVPTATMTGTVGTGVIRISIAANKFQ